MLFVAALPAFTVNSSSPLARVIWLIVMVVLPYAYFWSTARSTSDRPKFSAAGKRRYWPEGPPGYVDRQKKFEPIFLALLGIIVFLSLASFALAVAVTYDVTTNHFVLSISNHIISLGERLSSFIESLTTAPTIRDNPKAILKVQTIMSLEELWSLIFVFSWILMMISMSKKERDLFCDDVINWKKAPMKTLVTLLVSMLFFYIYWTGVADFSAATRGRYGCVMKIQCYATDDLLLIGTAIFKSIASIMLLGIIFTCLLKLWYLLTGYR